MGCKLSIAPYLEVVHHFIERCAGGRTRRLEPPATFGATKSPKTRLLNPYQLPAHGRLCRRAPTNTRLLSRDETLWFAINASFRSGLLPDCRREPSPIWAWRRCIERWAEFTCANLDGLSDILHTRKSCSRERLISGCSFEVSGIFLSGDRVGAS